MKFWIKKENDADPDVEWKDSYILSGIITGLSGCFEFIHRDCTELGSFGFGGDTELGGIDLFDDTGINRFKFYQSAVDGHSFGSHGESLLKV